MESKPMADRLHHEQLYRGEDCMGRLAATRLTLCGAGALGSHLADNLVRQGFHQIRVIDRDRVQQHNVSTQLYGLSDVGGWKVEILRNRLFRAVGVELDTVAKELAERNARKLLGSADVVLDTFDNSASRLLVQRQCRAAGTTCLHVGLFADYCEVIWDEQYRVPEDVGEDVCDYPLARNLVLLAVALASETLVGHVLEGSRNNWSATLGDFAVCPLEAGT